MKKTILLLLLCVFCLPFIVSAKEYCRVITGNGKQIGDEVQCGTESFYVVANDENQISLLAKYNLLVGDIIRYVEAEGTPTMNDRSTAEDYCMQLAEDSGYHPYYVYPMIEDVYYPSNLQGCRVYENIEYNHILQDSKAVGTRLVNGKSVLPLYGIVYMNPNWGYEPIHDGIYYTNEYDEHGNIILERSSFKKYLDGYKEELEDQDIEVSNVSFITLGKTLQLLDNISGEHVVVDLEYPEDGGYYDYPYAYTGKMDITQYLGNDYQWIYDVTYWLGSGFIGDASVNLDYFNDYYISNEGMLCAIGRGDCAYMPFPIGNGIRPLVTIPKSTVFYNIKTKTDGNGTIEVIRTASGNDFIQFKVTSKKDYILDKIIIRTDSGEVIEFNEGSIINNSDGTVSVDQNVFTMPFEDVTIEARWVMNPKTGVSLLAGFLGLLILIIISIYYRRKTNVSL